MLNGYLPAASRRVPYLDTLELTDADAPNDPITLAGVVTAGSAKICKPGSDTALIEIAWGAGLSSPATGILHWQFSDLSALNPGPYRLLITLTANGQAIEILDAVLPVN